MKNAKPVLTCSNLVVDAACLGFAGWTIVCNIAVFLGANTYQLLNVTAALLLAALLVLGLLVKRRGLQVAAALFRDDPEQAQAPAAGPRDPAEKVRVLAIVAALGISATYYVKRDYTLLWACSCIYFAAAYWLAARSSLACRPPRRSLVEEAALWVLAFLSMWVTLGSGRYDIDDSFYVNLGVAVTDFPSQPLQRFDTIHGLGLAIKAPYYRVHSFEALAGLLSFVTGIETIRVFHLFLAGVAGFLTPFAAARLLRILESRRWLWAVMVIIVFYLYFPGPHRSYGGFAFVRLFQGKAVFLTVLVPLIAAYGVRLGRIPTARNALFLAAAETAGMGMTSSAVWLSPLIGSVAVAAGLRFRLDDWKKVAYGALSSIYVLAVGALLFLTMKGGQTGGGTGTGEVIGDGASVKAQTEALYMVLGGGRFLSVSIAMILLSWPLCHTALARRFVAVFGLVFFLVLLNPHLASFLQHYVTGITYWRVLWALPMSTMVAICFTFVVTAPAGRVRGTLQVGLVAAMLAAYFMVFPLRRGASWGRPRLKVPREYAVAKALNRSLPPGSYALAPAIVSQYLPTFNHYSYPILAKDSYLQTTREDRRNRSRLVAYVSTARRRVINYRWFLGSLDRYKISGVAFLTKPGPRRWVNADKKLRAVLSRIGFRQAGKLRNHEIWIRRLDRKQRERGSAPEAPAGVVAGGKSR